MKHRMKLLALTLGTCALAISAPLKTVHAAEFNDAQKAELETLFKEFLSNNPEAILKSVDDFRAEQERQSQQSAQDNLEEYSSYFSSNDLPVAGNPNGDVTVVEYFDYNCGYCRKAFEDLRTLIEEDKNLRVVFQEMPILSPSSRKMSELALAANKQGKYFEMHVGLMEHKGSQSDEAFLKVAEGVGLDMDKLKADASSEEISAEIQATLDMGRALGIRGTPGFIVGNNIYPGYIGLDGLRNAIKEAREGDADDSE